MPQVPTQSTDPKVPPAQTQPSNTGTNNNQSTPSSSTELVFLNTNTAYVSKDNGLTVTVTGINSVDKGGFYEVTISYVEENKTKDTSIDEGQWKIYYKSGDSEPQYGFFNKLYPGEKNTQSYTYKVLKSQEPICIEYAKNNFFSTKPSSDTLKWKINLTGSK